MTPPSMHTWDGIPALRPLSWLYGAAVAGVRALRAPGRPASSSPRIVSIGNLEVGGSGKTPLCAWCLERARDAGRRVAYASRGFGGDAERGPLVSMVLGAGAPPPDSFAGLRVVAHDADLARALGDEAALVARRAPEATVVVARDKRRAIGAAARAGAEIVIVDDAFQSFALARHVDVVLLDARRPLANGLVLPAGRLREAPSALARADVVVFNGAADADAVAEARVRVARWLRPHQRVLGLSRSVTVSAANVAAHGTPRAVVLACAVARPDDVRASVEAVGVGVDRVLAWRDHHRYTASDVDAIRARARGVVTTEKDWVKLERFDWGDTPVWVARLDVAVVGTDDGAWLLG